MERGLSSPQDNDRKRVSKACDRCRLKKIKVRPGPFVHANHYLTVQVRWPHALLAVSGREHCLPIRRKEKDYRAPYPTRVSPSILSDPGRIRLTRQISYVEYLEEQQKLLVRALKSSWSQSRSPTSTWYGDPDPPIHAILEDLGVLSEGPASRSAAPGFVFEEDLEELRSRCEFEADDPVSSASQGPSQVPSQAPSHAPTPATNSPAPSVSRPPPAAGEPLMPDPWSQSAQQSLLPSESSQPGILEPTASLYHAHTYPPALYAYPNRPDWRLRPQAQYGVDVEPTDAYEERPGQYSGSAGMEWTAFSAQLYQQHLQRQQQQQQPGSQNQQLQQQQQAQQRPSFARASSQPEVSTISPTSLALPRGAVPEQYEIPDEETFMRWIRQSEQRE